MLPKKDEIAEIKMVGMPLREVIDYTQNIYSLTCAATRLAVRIQKEDNEDMESENFTRRYDHLQRGLHDILDGKVTFETE